MTAITIMVSYGVSQLTFGNLIRAILALFLYIGYQYRDAAIGTMRRPDLKGPKPLPIIGHMALMSQVPGNKLYDFYVQMYEQYGSVWSISLPLVGRMIQGDTPEILDHVLRTQFWSYEKGPKLRYALSDLLGEGIFMSDGHRWKMQRKQSSYIFTVQAFREYTSQVFVQQGHKVIEYLHECAENGTIFDFHELFLKYTLDCFGSISFGESFGCLDDIEKEVPFATAFDDLTEVCSDRLVDPAWPIRERLTGVTEKVIRDKHTVRSYAMRLIEKRRREGFFAEQKDILQLFLEALDENGEPLTDDDLIDTIMSFTIAGRDTTAQSLCWMIYSIFREGADKSIRTRLTKEVDQVLQGRSPTFESHKRQHLSEACFLETLRLFPAVPRNLKMCVKDDIWPDGTKIYKGDWYCWSSWVMGRSEAVWGPDAKVYKPERWMDGSERPAQCKFSSFNVNPRGCLGKSFAQLEATTIMSMILAKFDIELEDPYNEPAYGASITLPLAKGLRCRIKHRSDAIQLED